MNYKKHTLLNIFSYTIIGVLVTACFIFSFFNLLIGIIGLPLLACLLITQIVNQYEPKHILADYNAKVEACKQEYVDLFAKKEQEYNELVAKKEQEFYAITSMNNQRFNNTLEQYTNEYQNLTNKLNAEHTLEMNKLARVAIVADIDVQTFLEQQSNFESFLQSYVSQMPGVVYERFVGYRLSKKGWSDIQYTPESGDYGADIIGKNTNGELAVVQCKRLDSTVGVDAVQEAATGKLYYHADQAYVATNSSFTASAIKMADEINVGLLIIK